MKKVSVDESEDLDEWRLDTPSQHAILDESQGVKLEKVQNLVYRMTYKGKSVVFELDDLSNVEPPASALAPGVTPPSGSSAALSSSSGRVALRSCSRRYQHR